MDSDNKKKQKKPLSMILAVIFLVALFGFIYWYILLQIKNAYPTVSNINSTVIKSSNQEKDLGQVKVEILIILRGLSLTGKYGQWPITAVTLSSDRGNPFIKGVNKIISN